MARETPWIRHKDHAVLYLKERSPRRRAGPQGPAGGVRMVPPEQQQFLTEATWLTRDGGAACWPRRRSVVGPKPRRGAPRAGLWAQRRAPAQSCCRGEKAVSTVSSQARRGWLVPIWGRVGGCRGTGTGWRRGTKSKNKSEDAQRRCLHRLTADSPFALGFYFGPQSWVSLPPQRLVLWETGVSCGKKPDFFLDLTLVLFCMVVYSRVTVQSLCHCLCEEQCMGGALLSAPRSQRRGNTVPLLPMAGGH